MIWGSLGSINFVVSSSYVRSADELTKHKKYKYAKLEIIKGKSRIQSLGEDSDRITMRGIFSDNFCKVEYEIKKIEYEARKKEGLVLVVGEDLLGVFVIEKFRVVAKEVSNKGKLRLVEFEMNLLEYH
jgi:phage protein U